MEKGNEPYIIIAQQHWALGLGSNARNLALELSKDRPVMYVNPPMDVKTALKEIRYAHGRHRLKLAIGFGKNTRRAAHNIWVHTPATISISISWIKNIYLHTHFNEKNARWFFKSLKSAIIKVGWQKDKCIVLNDSQMYTGVHTKKYLRPLLSFYYIRDNLVEHPYFKFHGSRLEPATISKADAIFTNSGYLAEYAKEFNPASINVGQGCELEIFDAAKRYPLPLDMMAIPKPRIGYTGYLTGERLDIALLETLALRNKNWHWVYIGPEEELFEQSKLHKMPNVHFLGTKKPSLLPAYIQHLDVCLNPQLVNPLTIGNYPRKIDEYLAMGKPVVATNTLAMQMFLPHVQLANSADTYKQAIEKALLPKDEKAVADAVAFAKGHTWQACIEKIYFTQKQLLNE